MNDEKYCVSSAVRIIRPDASTVHLNLSIDIEVLGVDGVYDVRKVAERVLEALRIHEQNRSLIPNEEPGCTANISVRYNPNESNFKTPKVRPQKATTFEGYMRFMNNYQISADREPFFIRGGPTAGTVVVPPGTVEITAQPRAIRRDVWATDLAASLDDAEGGIPF